MTTTTDEDQNEPVKPFAAVVQDLGRGAVHDDASMQLQALVLAVQAAQKKGRLTLTIEVAPMKGNANTVIVSAEISCRPPKGEMPTSVFYSDSVGNLVRDDPRQPTLPLREVSSTDRSDLRTAR